MLKNFLLAATILAAASSAHAATIVNLSASPTSPNAGPNSGSYTLNPVDVTLGAGAYTVSVVGIAGGGLYDAYTVYAPTATNLAYTDSQWSVTPAGGTAREQPDIGRFDTAAAALAAYAAAAPITFTLAATTVVAFTVDDTAFPYFGDDSGGVSLAVAAPEPASLALVGAALGGLALARRRFSRIG